MIISKGASLLRTLSRTNAIKNVRNMSGGEGWTYRGVGAEPTSKATKICVEVCGGVMWWWVLWHLWTEPEHITGEFPYPDPRQWTNEELGIQD